MRAPDRFVRLTVALLLLAGMAAGAGAADLPGQALVRLDPAARPAGSFSSAGVTIVDSIPDLQLYLVSFPPAVPFEVKQRVLARRPGVLSVRPNRFVHLLETYQVDIAFPDDSTQVFVSGEEPVTYYGQPSVYCIGLDSAHQVTRGGGVRVAVIDNGIDRAHPLFGGLNDSLLYDLIESDYDPSEGIGALRGHGTFVAGLISLAAPETELLIVRAFDGEGVSTVFTVAQAIDLAVSGGADVINMSFGTFTSHPTIELACSHAVGAGVALVASVGNSSLNRPVYPAAYPGVISVTAIDTLDLLAPFANQFAGIDLCAPGIGLYSALPEPYHWGIWSGTSFATALVSAIVGLLVSVSPDLSPTDAEAFLRSTATRDLAWGTVIPPDTGYGYGRVDALAAVSGSVLKAAVAPQSSYDIADLSAAVRIALTAETPDRAALARFDVNRDGIINLLDIELIRRCLFPQGGNSPTNGVTTKAPQ